MMIYWLVGYVLLSVFTYYFVLWAMKHDALEGNLGKSLISLIEQDKIQSFLILVAVLSPLIWTATFALMACRIIKAIIDGVVSLFKGEQV